jgi:hypothetical protein
MLKWEDFLMLRELHDQGLSISEISPEPVGSGHLSAKVVPEGKIWQRNRAFKGENLAFDDV